MAPHHHQRSCDWYRYSELIILVHFSGGQWACKSVLEGGHKRTISVCGGSMIIRSNVIETVCHQKNPSNDVKYITHMQNVLAKK